MTTIRVERYADVIDEITPLLRLHWEEIATFREHIPLDPDYARYLQLDEAGKLVIVVAREAVKLVGYSIFFLLHNPHYKSTLFAMSDIVYVQPEKRGGSVGIRLIKETERIARERGAVKMTWHFKPDHPSLGLLLDHLGYVDDEVTKAKILKG